MIQSASVIQAGIADAAVWSVEETGQWLLVLMLLLLVLLICTGLHTSYCEGLLFTSFVFPKLFEVVTALF